MNTFERLQFIEHSILTAKRCLHRDMKREALEEMDIASARIEAALGDQETLIMERLID